MFKRLVPLLLVGSNAFASSVTCKVAINPETMTAAVVSENGSTKDDRVHSASLILGDEHGQDSARLRVRTASGKSGEAYAFFNQEADGYTVECDGGKMNFNTAVQGTSSETVVVTESLRLDVVGCDGNLYVSTKGTTFVPGLCPAPNGN